MAKLKWGALVTDGRGKLGGHVLSKNRSGAYIRTKVTPVNRRTSYQTAVRAVFALITTNWSALTASAISAWNGAVNDWQTTDIFGDLTKPTGKNLHQRLNQNAINAGYPAIGLPPTKVVVPDDVITSAAIDITAGTITFTGIASDVGFRALISATPPLSRGTSFVKNVLRNIGHQPLDTYSPATAYADYVAKYGVPTAGDNIHVAVQYVAPTGQITPQQTHKAVVTP